MLFKAPGTIGFSSTLCLLFCASTSRHFSPVFGLGERVERGEGRGSSLSLRGRADERLWYAEEEREDHLHS